MIGLCAAIALALPAFAFDAGAELYAELAQASPATQAEVEALADELHVLGGEAAPEMFLVLWSGHLPQTWSPELERDLPLPASALEAVRLALLRLGDDELHGLLESIGLHEFDALERGAALRLLESRDLPGALDLALALSAPPNPLVPLPRFLRDDLRDAMLAILTREPGGAPVLRVRFAGIPTPLLPVIVDCLASLTPVVALEELSACLDLVPLANALLLRSIDRVARRAIVPDLPHVNRKVREQLESQHVLAVSLAARACAALGDEAAVERLITLISRTEPNVQRAAHRALVELAGMDHGTRALDWHRWYAAELAFWRGPGPELLSELPGMEKLDMGEALRDLAEHRLYRAEISRAILPCLANEEVGVRVLACAALGALGAYGVHDALESMLDDESELVRTAAGNALRRLPPNPQSSSS